MKIPDDLQKLMGKNIIIVADDVEERTKFVGKKGRITSWRSWKYERFLPVITLDSGEVVSDSKVWWGSPKSE